MNVSLYKAHVQLAASQHIQFRGLYQETRQALFHISSQGSWGMFVKLGRVWTSLTEFGGDPKPRCDNSKKERSVEEGARPQLSFKKKIAALRFNTFPALRLVKKFVENKYQF